MKTIEKAVLVYQAGIANVFSVECFNMQPFGREAQCLLQADFHTCETFCNGLKMAGVSVASAHCNMAGDIKDQPWNVNMDSALWREKMNPVWNKVVP
jgi:hypothetical protein